MQSYCVSCKKNTENENSIVRKIKQNRLMLLSKLCCLWQEKINFCLKKELNNISND